MSPTPSPSSDDARPAAPDGDGAAPVVAPPPRRWSILRRRTDAAPGADSTAEDAQRTEVIPAPPRPTGPRGLRRDRRRLLTTREEAVYHLGGLAFEMYRRDLLPQGVLAARAGDVAELDDTVRDIDVRLVAMERERQERRARGATDAAAGCCIACRTPFLAEARFCWQCGAQVVPPPIDGDDQVTAVISAPSAP